LGLLGAPHMSEDSEERKVEAAAAAAVLGLTALGVYSAIQHSRTAASNREIHLRKVITVNHPAEQLYSFWRKLENLPRVMRNLESVRVTGGNRSHWVALGPGGKRVQWDAEITEDGPNELVAWQSLPGRRC